MDISVNEGSKTIYKVSGTSSAGRVESNAQCLRTSSSPNDNHQPVHTGNVRDQTFTLDVIEKHSLLCKCLYKYIFIYLSPFQAIKAHKKTTSTFSTRETVIQKSEVKDSQARAALALL